MFTNDIDDIIKVLWSGEGTEELAEDIRRGYLVDDRQQAVERLANRLQADKKLARDCILDPAFCKNCDKGLTPVLAKALRKKLIVERANLLRSKLQPNSRPREFVSMVEQVLIFGLHSAEGSRPPGVTQERWQSLGDALWQGRTSDFLDTECQREIGDAFSENEAAWKEWLDKIKVDIRNFSPKIVGKIEVRPVQGVFSIAKLLSGFIRKLLSGFISRLKKGKGESEQDAVPCEVENWYPHDRFGDQDRAKISVSLAQIMMIILSLSILGHFLHYGFMRGSNSSYSIEGAAPPRFGFSEIPHRLQFVRLEPHKSQNSPPALDGNLDGRKVTHMAAIPVSNKELASVVFERYGLREGSPGSPATDVSESDAERYIERMMMFLKRRYYNSFSEKYDSDNGFLNLRLARVPPPLARKYLEKTEVASEQVFGRYMEEGLFEPLQTDDKGAFWLAFCSEFSDMEAIQTR